MTTIPVYPELPGLVFPIGKKPTFASIVATAVSGREVRSAQQAFPLWEFTLTYDHLKEMTQNAVPFHSYAPRQDLVELSQVFYAAAGQYGSFYFRDPSDCSRLGQSIGTLVAGGASQTFTAKRTWGIGSLAIKEPVGGINTIESVYVGGTLIPEYNWSFTGNLVTIVGYPNGGDITLDFSFYYLCRFIEDTQDYQQFMFNLWSLQQTRFRSIKDRN